jgi:hypothetical protein
MRDEAEQCAAHRAVHHSLEYGAESRFGSRTDLQCLHATVRYPRLARTRQKRQDEAIRLELADDAVQMHRIAPEEGSRIDLKPHPGPGDQRFLRSDRRNSNGADENGEEQSASKHRNSRGGATAKRFWRRFTHAAQASRRQEPDQQAIRLETGAKSKTFYGVSGRPWSTFASP